MKHLLLLLVIITTFQAKGQFKYEELSGTQKQQISAIETAYKKAFNGNTSVSYNEFMLEISNGGETQKLPLFDIKSISVEQNNSGYYLKLHHVGGWDYQGFYQITNRQNAETVKKQLQTFLDDFEAFSSKFLADLCDAARYLRPAKEDENYYDFEYRMLKLAGIGDPDNADDEEMKQKMSFLWKTHHKDFQCERGTNIYPLGNYLRQIARADIEDAFELLLDNYGFDPNVIDRDGCTVLDYLNAQISSPESYSYVIIDQFKKYRAILLKYGAKSANDFEGCKC